MDSLWTEMWEVPCQELENEDAMAAVAATARLLQPVIEAEVGRQHTRCSGVLLVGAIEQLLLRAREHT